MEDETQQAKSAFCSAKPWAKFCLVYVTTLLVLTLVFSAINNEPMNEEQTVWWWAFLGSLLITASISLTALIILIYTDFYRADTGEQEMDIGRSRIRPPMSEPNSASFKTIMTISSMPNTTDNSKKTLNIFPTQSTANELPRTKSAGTSKFVNLTPPKSPVTVIDMPSMNAKKKQVTKNATPSKFEEAANLAAVPSSNLVEAKETIKKEDRKKRKKGRRKNKKTTTQS